MNQALAPTMPAWASALLLLPAFVVVAAALVTRWIAVPSAWRLARIASGALAVGAVAVAVVRAATGSHAGEAVRLDTLTAALLGLIAVVGWVVTRYSVAYLTGDPYERHYVRRMLSTLAAVALVAVANNLVLLLVAWAAASVSLHGLLTFFGERPVAIAVAHKKFLLARLADACMVGAAVAFASTFGTLRIDAIGAEAMSASSLPAGARIAILLVALAAIVKCAQLPFHGWLIQVMEAPTPVSALLHAGVVNLGGFVLLRFAPVVDRSVETRSLLVLVGVSTAVVASLVMTTRVSVKVSLAWSTCAQMGFMLMQCGLGLWEMALLHLIAHSAYKAHAFLGAGGTVLQTQRRQLAMPQARPNVRSMAVGASVALLATAAVGGAWELVPLVNEISVTLWLMLGIVALAIVPLTTKTGNLGPLALLGPALGVPFVYLALHELVGRLVPYGSPPPIALLVFTGSAFVLLFVIQSACIVAPGGRLATRIRPWIYSGLFLDDAFTRVAFALFPPPAPTRRVAPLPQPAAVAVIGVGDRATTSPPSLPAHPPLLERTAR